MLCGAMRGGGGGSLRQGGHGPAQTWALMRDTTHDAEPKNGAFHWRPGTEHQPRNGPIVPPGQLSGCLHAASHADAGAAVVRPSVHVICARHEAGRR